MTALMKIHLAGSPIASMKGLVANASMMARAYKATTTIVNKLTSQTVNFCLNRPS